MKTIFITAIGGDIGYGIIKAIRSSKYDFRIIGCDVNDINYSRDMVDEFIKAEPYTNILKWIDFTNSIIKDYHVDYFWPVTEPEIRIVEEYNTNFDMDKVIINQSQILSIALDKYNTAHYLNDNGIIAPNTWSNLDDVAKVFPLIVKERNSCGSHGVIKVENEHELIKAYLGMEKPVVQEYVGDADEEYTMTIFSDGQVTNSIVFKRKLGFGGLSRQVLLCKNTELELLGERIAKCMELKGSINVQMRKQNDKYYVFEINPRISSTISFRTLLGFNDVEWWLDIMENKKISKYQMPDGEIYGVRNVEEKIFIKDAGGNIYSL